ncbi:MAG: sensor histidine kinase, partial [Spirochaetales bacterium]|nr:sensor histidine kinase [Spirochaetales bacterium]
AASQPVFDITGNITGVLSIDLFLSHLQNFLNRINISKNGEIFIIERSGLLIASSTSEIPIKKDITENSSRRLFAGESRESFIYETVGKIKSIFGDFSNVIKDEHFDFRIGKENYMAHISPLKDEYGIDWLIVVAIPEKDYMEDIWKNNAQLIYILIAAAIISSLLSLLTSSWIVRPVQRLNLSTGKLIEKKWVLKEESYFNREIDSLNTSFNTMAVRLTDALRELTTEVKERKRAEGNLVSLLEEKDVILQEVHHRVKNNLQLITSLLKIQGAKIEEKKYAEIFKESRNRVSSMALIHQQLYQSENFNEVHLEEYIKSLIKSLLKSYQNDSVHIETEVHVEKNLPLDYAIPCGLIINELVTNSLKYAFNELEKGKISVKFESDNKQIVLVISDNGSGIPESIKFDTSDTLG